MTLRIYGTFVAVLLTLTAAAQTAPKKDAVDARAIHFSALIVDTHADTPQYFNNQFNLASGARAEGRHFDLDSAQAGHV
ncbi:MAG: hypothetical protein ACRD2Y_15910, partial [Terriglobales bacterium]